MKKSLIIVIASLIAVLLIIGGLLIFIYTGLNKSNNLSSKGGIQVTMGHAVLISDNSFTPSQIIINTGDTIVWINNGATGHTVASDSGNELNSSVISPGTSYSHTFNMPGTYNYHCSLHSSMIGEVIVV